jgi:prevent-host-death family protein
LYPTAREDADIGANGLVALRGYTYRGVPPGAGLLGRSIDKVASRGYFISMQKVGLKTLKNKLSEYVRLAASGETVVITDRGRTVAEIVPPRPGTALTPFEERGVREGWLRPAKRPFQPLPPRKPIPGYTLEELLTDLDCDREDRC